MRDVQSEPSLRKINIDKVGVKNIRYPIMVLDKKKETQETIANISMMVNLPHKFRGTHMSRFVEILNEYHGKINIANMKDILQRIKTRLNAESAHLEITFPYFVEKRAPVTKSAGLVEYQCKFITSLDGAFDFLLAIDVPVTTVCPCSKEISKYGAHNQRGRVTLSVRFKEFVWIEDLIEIVEKSASSGVYSLLKREDEKYVTEKGYENPMFVEDVVREIAKNLESNSNIYWFTVEAENFESIHNHSAYAFFEKKNSPPQTSYKL